MKGIKKVLLAATACCVITSASVSAAGESFEFIFEDLANYTYYKSWEKGNTSQAYTITLNKYNGLTKNTMSSTNIFGCRMKDMSIGPVVDVYHTYSNYVTNYPQAYIEHVSQGDEMKLGAKKDSDSTSSSVLRISGSIVP